MDSVLGKSMTDEEYNESMWSSAHKHATEMAAEVEREILVLRRKRKALLNSAVYFDKCRQDKEVWPLKQPQVEDGK